MYNNMKENLSASVLFTFTPKMKYLLQMLQEGINPRFVYERLPVGKRYYIAPMKCFCDIPLGMVKNHMQRYGFYGLGLKKSFLQEHRVTPVVYLHKNSLAYFNLNRKVGENMGEVPFLPLLKRYLGDDYFFSESSNQTQKKRIHFYDEREWRYIPEGYKLEMANGFKTIEEGLSHVMQMNKNTAQQFVPIKIPIEALDYIIIRKRKELAGTLTELRHIFGSKDRDLLYTKVLIAENIISDF
jgi:hypothetical protein